MTRRLGVAALALVLAAACSTIDELADGVIALEVRAPDPTTIEVGDTARFSARALNVDGDSVAADIQWVSAEPQNVEVVDATAGLVVGRLPNTAGRIQAVLGDFRSGFTTISVTPRADTLALVEPTTVTVGGLETVSPQLVASVQSFEPAGPVASRPVVFAIVDPAIPDTAARPVEFTNGFVADTVLTGSDGQTLPGAQLRRIEGRTAPATVLVEVTALRGNGTVVAGSGQRFTVNFESAGALR